ncbi:GTP cyclohydrolase I domain, partial [Dillenia turbinata]
KGSGKRSVEGLLSMGALEEGHFNEELEKLGGGGCVELSLEEQQPDTVAIEDAVKVLLQGLDEDVNREGLKKTPLRVAKALREGTSGYGQKVKDIVQGALFPEAGLDAGVGHAGGAGGLVVVRDLDLFSYCESCLLPFQVKCHVGYVPSGQQVVGLSKLSRVADVFAKRLQDPQRLVEEVCSALQQGIKPDGAAVVLQCLHINFPKLESFFPDPNHQRWVKVLVSSGSGVFEDKEANVWVDFLSLLKFRGIDAEKIYTSDSADQYWCPSRPSSGDINKLGSAHPGMTAAVTSILKSLGEDPSRKELIGTPSRFVKWLMNFKNANLEMKLNGFVCGRPDFSTANGGASHDEGQINSELSFSFWSQCEHHLLPFHGVVHIGYLSAGVHPIGRALLQSIVHFHGFRLQVQERLTRQIAETVSSVLGADVVVVVEAIHTCMISRGIEKFGSSTATIAVLGRFSTDPNARAKFLQCIPSTMTSEG